MIYKFVRHDIEPLEKYKAGYRYILHEKLVNGEEITREDKNYLVFPSSEPTSKLMGYAYDYREFLRKFWVKTEFYGILEVWAWDKTAIRKSDKVKPCKIMQIVEIRRSIRG